MGFPRRREGLLHPDVEMTDAESEPGAAPGLQPRGLDHLREAEQPSVEAAGSLLAAPGSYATWTWSRAGRTALGGSAGLIEDASATVPIRWRSTLPW